MCPMCLSTLGWVVLGGGTGSGVLAGLVLAVRRRKSKDDDNE